ncbi:MAG TPA: CARDB domain-containing protein [Candidatus Thermoplasmatota archaeon]|nr:CARDB domain-containing protein [Candidatus Thermoplasmatota archaeon]
MGKNILKRSLIVGIVLLIFSMVCFPVLAQEGKPDLIATNIFQSTYYDDFRIYHSVTVEVQNIGNATANGSKLQFHVAIQRLLLGIFPLKSIFIEKSSPIQFDMPPGFQFDFPIDYTPTLFGIPFGFYKLNCTVNPNKTIEESNYTNNFIEKRFFFSIPIY